MAGFAIVDVVIGLAVVFFLLSIVCSALVEMMAGWFRWRAKNLTRAVSGVFQDHALLLWEFFQHPRIWTLSPDPILKAPEKPVPNTDPSITGRGRPSYIAAGTFTDVLIEITVGKQLPASLRGTFAGIRSALSDGQDRAQEENDADEKLSPDDSKEMLLKEVLRGFAASALEAAADAAPDADRLRLAAFRNSLQGWFDETMQRAGGWYKRRAQLWLLAVGLLLAAIVNIDAIAVTQGLYSNSKLRQQMDAVAERLAQQQNPTGAGDVTNRVEQARKELQAAADTGMPLGWGIALPNSGWLWVVKIVGFVMTGAAVSLGAPFWFDLLNNLVNLRSSGQQPQKPHDDSGAADGAGGTQAPPMVVGLPAPATSAITASAAGVMPALAADYWSADARERDFATFKSTADGYESSNAASLARASLLAYCDGGVVNRVCARWKFDGVRWIDRHDTEAFIAWNTEIVLVAFRGTEPTHVLDLLADAKCALVDAAVSSLADDGTPRREIVKLPSGKAHGGFLRALGWALDDIDKAVSDAVGDGHPRKLWITGHSLGAALATLYAARVQYASGSDVLANVKVQGLYTFGSPRVGDDEFVASLAEPLAKLTFRFVNHEDLVTRVAPRAFGYGHVGRLMYLLENGMLDDDQSAGWIRFLNTVADALNDLKLAARTSVKDHSMELYVRKLENLAAR